VEANKSDPYAAGPELLALCEETGLTKAQVTNYLSNVRRRHLRVKRRTRKQRIKTAGGSTRAIEVLLTTVESSPLIPSTSTAPAVTNTAASTRSRATTPSATSASDTADPACTAHVPVTTDAPTTSTSTPTETNESAAATQVARTAAASLRIETSLTDPAALLMAAHDVLNASTLIGQGHVVPSTSAQPAE
jgi:hypothetical protein